MKPTTKLEFERGVTRNKRGHLGARARVRIPHPHWPVTYEFDTHGMSSAEAVQKVEALERKHEKWALRQTGFAGVVGAEVVVAGDVFRIMTCTIPPSRPFDDVYLMLCIRQVVGSDLQTVEGWPLQLHFNSIDDVPPNGAIIEEVRKRLQERRSVRDAHNAYTEKVNQLVKG
jgi:hypothetical protein